MDRVTVVYESTALIDTRTGEYPLYIEDVRKKFPDWSIPSKLQASALEGEPFLMAVVQLTQPPAGDVPVELPPKQIDGYWTQQWTTRDFTPGEVAERLRSAKDIRKNEIQNVIAAAFYTGMEVRFGETTHTLLIESTHRIHLTALSIQAKEALREEKPFSASIRTKEGVTLSLTAQETIDLSNEVTSRVQEGLETIWSLMDRAEAATVAEELPPVPGPLFVLN